MKPKIIRAEHAQYVQSEWEGQNQSGWGPWGNGVLILIDVASEAMGESQTILVPDDQVKRNTLASETGIVIDISPGAFKYTLAGQPIAAEARVPKVGDRIIFQRYAGQAFWGEDGEFYRMMSDESIYGIQHVTGLEASTDV